VIDYDALGRAAQLSVPTNEHYLPLLYALALRDDRDAVTYFNDRTTMGGVSMRSLLIG
jgi:4,5-DOPA dioxygenase extradiol